MFQRTFDEIFLAYEDIREDQPVNPSLLFPVAAGKIYCLTNFKQMTDGDYITHHWYFRDDPVATFRLQLQPPEGTTFSFLQLRGVDKGPWRVEVKDAGGRLLKVLRFSVTD